MQKIDIAKSLKAKRQELHISRAELAKCLGVVESTVWRWECGQCNISLHRWIELQELLKEFSGSLGEV